MLNKTSADLLRRFDVKNRQGTQIIIRGCWFVVVVVVVIVVVVVVVVVASIQHSLGSNDQNANYSAFYFMHSLVYLKTRKRNNTKILFPCVIATVAASNKRTLNKIMLILQQR